MSSNSDVIIRFEDRDRMYEFTEKDFQRVEEYCENECLGIQFLQSANVLRQLVDCLRDAGSEPPFSLEELSSDIVLQHMESSGGLTRMENLFGTPDLKVVSKVVAKQTYNFIHKL